MFRSIRYKLFVIFLATTLLVVIAMYVFVHWSLQKGFKEMVETRQHEREINLIESLTELYQNDNQWHELANNKQKWLDLLLQTNPRRRLSSNLDQTFKDPNNLWPPTPSQEIEKQNYTPFELRVMLLNADKKIIFGRDDALNQLTLKPIYNNTTVVGFLGILPGKTIRQANEARFLEQQSKAFIFITLLMIALSACLAFMLAYLLGRPIKHIISATKVLALGKYDIALPVESGDEIGELSRNFNDLACALEQSEQARKKWMEDISHELRTPLAVLRGELEALQDGIRPLNRNAIDSLFSEVMRLNRLTDDLYQLSLTDHGGLSYKKNLCNPIEILQEDINAFKTEYANKNITISLNNSSLTTAKVYADHDRLSQLFRNLLTNSLNYTDEYGRLAITISIIANNLELVFSDSEPGIDDHEISKIFDRFYRVATPNNRKHPGAGLGLAICSNIIKAHNGKISASPSPFNGLSIRVLLPICP